MSERGTSLQAIETENAERLKKGELRILQLIGLTISVALLMIGVSVLVTRNVARRVRSDYRAFSAFFEKAAQGVATIDPAAIGIGEFEKLAHGANRMVAERQAYQARASLAEDALHRSEARFLAMAGAAPMSIAVKDLDGHFEWANDELLNRCMMSLDTLVGKTSYDLHPKEIADEVSTGREDRPDNTDAATGPHRADLSRRGVADPNCSFGFRSSTPTAVKSASATWAWISPSSAPWNASCCRLRRWRRSAS